MTTADKVRPLLDRLGALHSGLFQKDFLLTWEQTDDELKSVITIAEILEHFWKGNISARVFNGGLAVSNFRDNSTRTRFSFASAASLLGLNTQDIDEAKSQVAHGETVRETANMISFLTEAYGIRDDLFLGEGHKYMSDVSTALQQGYEEGVLPQRPAVINLQCDLDHPTQSCSDLMHLQAMYGSLEALRGKKLAMTWAYSPSYGKPLSVPQGICTLMTRFGMDVVLAHPEGYDLVPETIEISKKHAAASGGTFTVANSMEEAFIDADIVYPKSWAPWTVMQERTSLLRSGQGNKVQELEKKALENNLKYRNWECTEALMSQTKGGKAHYMHCLPADISEVSCKEGEVAASVFDRYRAETYQEASHKLYVIAAMIMATRFENPKATLEGLLAKATPRKLA
ncbi:MAG: knotted carbamoyltransferase YgeW [Deltaproteobacteria bacterium CG2_30_63_29]|nr:MAG: knotted carbamoyltransferase YgeW [Deltaproteobacteria bacterium CG2_30_63_29]PIW00597.1 MAG: knotted carbamoyltransferase YgeW [Deltaproteobacteria bacterium CG17_big_fil_post_rev_8_21_14_2_50_63_7]PJB44357.1 MAG: knotted carbamoyltransferase YgeW [Deltaproteobacteria bacterium CG_4_9_14_3_um_filter_63_12]